MNSRFIVFDLGNVLVRLDVPRGFATLAALAGTTAAEVEAFLADGPYRDFTRGRRDGDGFTAAFNDRYGVRVAPRELEAAWARFITGPNRPVAALLAELLAPDQPGAAGRRHPGAAGSRPADRRVTAPPAGHGSGAVRVAVLSNTDPWHYRECVRCVPSLARVPATLSCQAGALKPDPAIYHALLARLGTTPQECLFIDDKTENVAAAEALGMAGVVYAPGSDGSELRARIVAWVDN